jgi:hypothetical protein
MERAENESSKFVAERVLRLLRDSSHPLSAKEIANTLRESRSLINKVLYRLLLPAGRIQVSDQQKIPKWHAAPLQSEEECSSEDGSIDDYGCSEVVVLIDLGNVHDCLSRAVVLKNTGYVNGVAAFADNGFRGYGVNPRVEGPNVTLIQPSSAESQAADVELIWYVANYCKGIESSKKKTHFVLASKDKGFAHLANKVREYGHHMTVVKDVKELDAVFE